MKWLFDFLFKSSIGRKVVMSLSGLFLIVFLVVHLLGNLQLLYDDEGMQFNKYTYFMTHNPLIISISYFLYFTILLHSIQGVVMAVQNKNAKGRSYEVQKNTGRSYFAKYMMHLGIIIFIFLAIHLYQFWLQMKLGNVPMVQYPGSNQFYKDLYTPVLQVFNNSAYVVFYVISMMVLSFHLLHGFKSSFQSLGINHKKYNPLIHWLGILYSILIPLGFAIIPIYLYLFKANLV
jgi:succinate dehydrogenase / fumarate reductase, cytochrome b subunit